MTSAVKGSAMVGALKERGQGGGVNRGSGEGNGVIKGSGHQEYLE